MDNSTHLPSRGGRLDGTHRIALIAVLLWFGAAPLPAQSDPARFAITAPVADLHGGPTPESDIVSQAIFGSDAVLLQRGDGWLKVRTSDDYEGWVDARELVSVASPYAAEGRAGLVESVFAALYREADIEKHEPLLTVPFESKLEITGEQETADGRFYSVRLPDGATAWVQSGDINFDTAPLSIAATLSLARRFLGLPYRWGGTSTFGFDCSGFTQMLMRRRGVFMPRDTRPQSRWDGLEGVDRSQLQPGDLLFFGKIPGKINHTAMYIGGGEFIHATRRGRPVVQIGCLESEPWTREFITARRAP